MTLAPAQIRVSRTQLPKRLAGLGLWLDASVTSSLTLNGDTVSEWRDLSGRGRHFAQATAASQPDGANRTYNGLRVIDFDGTRFLQGNAATLDLTRDVPGLTILMVGKADSQGQQVGRWYKFTVGGSEESRSTLFVRENGLPGQITLRTRRLDADAQQDADYNAGISVRDAAVFTSVIDYEAAEIRLYSDSSLVASNLAAGTTGRTQDSDSQDVALGAAFINANWIQPLNGFIAELLVYRRVLSDAERGLLEQYLIRKWNPQPEPPLPAISLWQAETREPVYHWSM